jgi:hypothetical protein
VQWLPKSAADFSHPYKQKLLTFFEACVSKFALDSKTFVCYIIPMMNEKKHWTIVTPKGTRWAVQATTEKEARENWFGHDFGIQIAEVQPVYSFTKEELFTR